ncbi:sensor histidine kinase [Ulvibacter litoralis]|nr:sensor histidine kinase [Ulvibacter litoralis]
MSKRIIVLVQLVLWLTVWLVIGLNERSFERFLSENWAAFLFQIFLILLVSYYIAEKWLFTKKYLLFSIISVVLIVGCAYVSSSIFSMNPPGGFPRMNRGPKPPSPFSIHALLLSVAYIISTLVMTFIDSQKKEALLEMQKTALIESELKFLKMQINPHFLFNSLNNIYALSISNSERTPESIHSLSEMLRYVIYDCENPKVPIEKEINYIENFIDLFKLRSSKGFNITFTNQIENSSVAVAPMLFITFIENAFKHSGIEKGGDAFVNIALQSTKNDISLKVENSLPKETIVKDGASGIGLQNAKKRLEITYPNKHELTIESLTTFKIELKILLDA